MAQFALYHYELSAFRNKEPRLFVINDPERSYDSMEQLFESFLPGRGSSLNVLSPATFTGDGGFFYHEKFFYLSSFITWKYGAKIMIHFEFSKYFC